MGVIGVDRSESSIIAAFEQVLYDRMAFDREIPSTNAVKRLLGSIHKDEASVATFEKYVEVVHASTSQNPYIIELKTILDELVVYDDPIELMKDVINEERSGGLVTETTLKEDFFGKALYVAEGETPGADVLPEATGEARINVGYELGPEDIANISEYFSGEMIFADF